MTKYIIYIDKGTDGTYLYSPGIMNEKKYNKWREDNPLIEIYKILKYED